MAMPLMGETCVSELKFYPTIIAPFVGKDPSTVKRWFLDLPGVRRFPRGLGAQRPSLEIPESVVRSKLKEIGYTDQEIETGLIVPYRRRLDLARAEVAQAQVDLAPKRKRGRPPKAIKLSEPAAKKAAVSKRR